MSHPSLTEAMLQRHNETETSTVKPIFGGKEITVDNRYIIIFKCIAKYTIMSLLHVFSDTTTSDANFTENVCIVKKLANMVLQKLIF